jgi:hypothetical protein
MLFLFQNVPQDALEQLLRFQLFPEESAEESQDIDPIVKEIVKHKLVKAEIDMWKDRCVSGYYFFLCPNNVQYPTPHQTGKMRGEETQEKCHSQARITESQTSCEKRDASQPGENSCCCDMCT